MVRGTGSRGGRLAAGRGPGAGGCSRRGAGFAAGAGIGAGSDRGGRGRALRNSGGRGGGRGDDPAAPGPSAGGENLRRRIMILCRECGNSAPSRDGFCSSCGALLDWSGERVETQVLPTVQTAPTGQTVPPIPATAAAGAGAAQAEPQGGPYQAGAYQGGIAQGGIGQGGGAQGWTPAAEARRADPVPVQSEPDYDGPYCQACGV